MAKSQRLSNLPNAPAFSAYGSALQSVADQTYTKVSFNTEEFDTASCYDHTTNYRFTPNVAGYYQINALVNTGSSANGAVWILLYKNGSVFKNGTYTANDNVAPTINLSTLVYANGTTDYFEVYVWQNSGSAMNMGSANERQYFQGVLVRPAA